jgi:hypothetical protein
MDWSEGLYELKESERVEEELKQINMSNPDVEIEQIEPEAATDEVVQSKENNSPLEKQTKKSQSPVKPESATKRKRNLSPEKFKLDEGASSAAPAPKKLKKMKLTNGDEMLVDLTRIVKYKDPDSITIQSTGNFRSNIFSSL